MFNLLCLLGQQVHRDLVDRGSSLVPRTPKGTAAWEATHVPNLTGELSTASIWYGSFNLVSHYSTLERHMEARSGQNRV